MLRYGTTAAAWRVSRIATLLLLGFSISVGVRALSGFKCSTRSYHVVDVHLVDTSGPEIFLPTGTIGVWYNCDSVNNGADEKCFKDWSWDLSLKVMAEPGSQYKYSFDWNVPNEAN